MNVRDFGRKLVVFLFCFSFSSLGEGAIVENGTSLWRNCQNSSEKRCTIRIKFHRNIPDLQKNKADMKVWLGMILRYANIKLLITNRRPNITIKKVQTLSHANMGKSSSTTLGLNYGFFGQGWVGDYEQRRSTFLHEFMHILGFTHEHEHYKRTMNFSDFNIGKYCKSWEDNQKLDGSHTYNDKYCKRVMSREVGPEDSKYISDYDFLSITHYDFPYGYQENGKTVKYDWGPDFYYTQRTLLSLEDKIALAKLYPGKVRIEDIPRMHQVDLQTERVRVEKAMFFNGCAIVKRRRATNSCYYVIKKNDQVIPEVNGICYQKWNVAGAIAKMKRSSSCQ